MFIRRICPGRPTEQPWTYRYFAQVTRIWGPLCGCKVFSSNPDLTRDVPVASPRCDRQRCLPGMGGGEGCKITLSENHCSRVRFCRFSRKNFLEVTIFHFPKAL